MCVRVWVRRALRLSGGRIGLSTPRRMRTNRKQEAAGSGAGTETNTGTDASGVLVDGKQRDRRTHRDIGKRCTLLHLCNRRATASLSQAGIGNGWQLEWESRKERVCRRPGQLRGVWLFIWSLTHPLVASMYAKAGQAFGAGV